MKPKKTKTKSWIKKIAPSIGLGGRMMDYVPYFFFGSFLAFCMVWNAYRGQNLMKKIQIERRQVNNLRSKASVLTSEINNENKQSALLERMRHRNIGLTGSSPRKIIAKND